MVENLMQPGFLRCEYLVDPLGIDVKNPRLSWVLESIQQSQKQTSYHIIVASSEDLLANNKGDLWDTNQVNSEQCNQIVYEGEELKSQIFCYWKVKVWDKDGKPSEWSSTSQWSMGLLKRTDWKAKWIGEQPRKRPSLIKRKLRKKLIPSPLLRRSFETDKNIAKALVYITALGEYELRINGKRVGDHILAPEWTDYKKRVQYQTYDVAELIQKGENVMGVILADGWYAGHVGPGLPMHHSYYGINRTVLIQLIIEYSDGTKEEITSDSSWKIFADGPIQNVGHFEGETYDTGKEQKNWDGPEFDDSEWLPITIYNNINIELNAQMNEPIRIIEELKPIALTEPKPGLFVFDLGQNIQGWCKIHVNSSICLPNSTIILRHGEMLEPDGTVFTTNLRSAKATDKYLIKDVEDRWIQPHFTYHGFRFVEIEGFKKGAKPTVDTIIGCVISSSSLIVSSFESSDPTLNQLWKNILWTQIDNLISIPTDCPQRDERMGWMGDAQVFSRSSIYNMDMAAFYTKFNRDIRDSQDKKGRFADFVPYPYNRGPLPIRMAGSPAWADAGIIIPWDVYLNYGDKRIIEQHYEAAKRFVNYIHKKNQKFIWKKKKGFNYGDWLNSSKFKTDNYPRGKVPKVIFATAYFAHSVEIVSKMAQLLGRDTEHNHYSKLAESIREAFVQKFVDVDGIIEGESQAGYALALNYNILPENLRQKAAEHMIREIENYDGRISTGFCTTLKLMTELTRWGHKTIAYELLFSRRFPSWFYMIDQGATTMWERWDSWTKEHGHQSKLMNSFNHYTIGSVVEWMYRIILGINFDEQTPGFKHILIQPQPGRPLTWAKGHYNSIYGNIEVEWSLDNEDFTLKVKIPPNTTATVHLPTEIIEIDSGYYEFTAK